jgi:hypothetical protein
MLIQQHAEAIIAALAATLHAPDPRAKLEAAKLLLLWGWGRPDEQRTGEAGPAGRLSHAHLQRAIDLLSSHLEPDGKGPNPAATPCPARHAEAGPDTAASPSDPCGANPAINPMPRERDTQAAVAVTPALTREPPASPLAAPVGAESPRRDADPMSRQLLPSSHSADSAFRRRLPLPPPAEPPGFYAEERRKRWPPWR